MSAFTAADLERARDRFFPDWWTHHTRARIVTDAPQYLVRCRSEDEAALARAAQPHYIRADIQLVSSEASTASSGRGSRHRAAITSRHGSVFLPDVSCATDLPVRSLEAVAAEETRVRREVWVLAVTIDYEVGTVYQNVIAANIRAGRHYTYFLPADINGGVAHALESMLHSLKKHGLTDETLQQHLRVFAVRDTNLLANLTLFDPRQGAKRGYLLPVYSDKQRGFQVPLDDALHDRVAARMHAWRQSDAECYPTPIAFGSSASADTP